MKKIIALALLSMTLISCNNIAVKPEVKKQIRTVDHIIVVPKNSILIKNTHNSMGGQGGLLGVMIAGALDNIQNSNNANRSSNFKRYLEDYDFKQSLLTSFDNKIKRVNIPYTVNTRILPETSSLDIRNFINNSQADVVLVTNGSFALSPDGFSVSKLEVHINSKMYPTKTNIAKFSYKPNTSDILSEDNIIYHNYFSQYRKNPVASNALKTQIDYLVRSVMDEFTVDLQNN